MQLFACCIHIQVEAVQLRKNSLANLELQLAHYAAVLAGQEQVEVRCQRLCQDLLSLTGHTLSDSLVQWAAITPASGYLASCLFPGIRPAMGQCTPALEKCLEAWPASMAALFHSARYLPGNCLLGSLSSAFGAGWHCIPMVLHKARIPHGTKWPW